MTSADGQAAPVAGALPAFMPLPMKGRDVSVERRADGVILICLIHATGESPTSIAKLLAQRAAEHPDRAFILQREPGDGPWRGVTYGDALRSAEGVAQ